MSLLKRITLTGTLLTLSLTLTLIVLKKRKFNYDNFPTHNKTELLRDYFVIKSQNSKRLAVKPENSEKLKNYTKKNDGLIFFYIHDFASVRNDGEFILDKLVYLYKSRVYYTRLPGHGIREDLQPLTVNENDYLKATLRDLQVIQNSGDKVIIVGTGMGAVLALLLATKLPEKIEALILISPLFRFTSIPGWTDKIPAGLEFYLHLQKLIAPLQGERTARRKNSTNRFWKSVTNISHLAPLITLQRHITENRIMERIRPPILLFYYYKNEKQKDEFADIPTMLEALAKAGLSAGRHPLNYSMAIPEGGHALFAKNPGADEKLIVSECRTFIDDVLAFRSN